MTTKKARTPNRRKIAPKAHVKTADPKAVDYSKGRKTDENGKQVCPVHGRTMRKAAGGSSCSVCGYSTVAVDADAPKTKTHVVKTA